MKEIFDLINKMSPYLLLGFMLAGIMHAFVPGKLYRSYLAPSNFRSVFLSALFGIPLPLCSCGVIPTAMSLYREGASKGATVSFLIATPQTGVDSIFATYSLMGLPFAILRPVVALITSLFGGILVNLADKKTVTAAPPLNSVSDDDVMAENSFMARVRSAFHYAFVELLQDIGKWLMLGLVVAGLITVFVPASFFAVFSESSLLSMLLVLLVSVPMYMCATGSIPIAVALMLKGLSPGTALVLLMAGPAANVASILVINKVLGRRTLFFYLLAIIFGAISFGLFVDYCLPREWFTEPIRMIERNSCDAVPCFGIVCSALLFLLLINAFVRKYFFKKTGNGMGDSADDAKVAVIQTFNIEGMRCNHCRGNVEKTIASLANVTEVSVSLEDSKAVVKGNVAPEEVIAAVESLGFKAFKE